MTLKIEAGKYYKTRVGDKVHIAFIYPETPTNNYPVLGRYMTTNTSGTWTLKGKHDKSAAGMYDIVAEWVEPLKLEAGKYYKTRNGDKAHIAFIYPETPTNKYPVLGKSMTTHTNGIWTLDGKHLHFIGLESPHDLVAEWVEPLKLAAGKAYLTARGEKVWIVKDVSRFSFSRQFHGEILISTREIHQGLWSSTGVAMGVNGRGGNPLEDYRLVKEVKLSIHERADLDLSLIKEPEAQDPENPGFIEGWLVFVQHTSPSGMVPGYSVHPKIFETFAEVREIAASVSFFKEGSKFFRSRKIRYSPTLRLEDITRERGAFDDE